MSVPSHFEFLRKEAKALLKECRAGNRQTLDRLRIHLPRLGNLEIPQVTETIKLGDVQHAIARERGYTNWGELKHEDSLLEQFLLSIRGNSFKGAQRALASRPQLASESIHAGACAIGDPEAVAQHLDSDPQLVTTGHRGWTPLFYACASLLNRVTARQSAGILECVRILLDRGADPNTSARELSALRRAMLSGNFPVVMLLLQRGAKPNIQQWTANSSDAFKEFFASPEVRERYQERMVRLAKEQGETTLWGSDKWWFHAPNAEPPMMTAEVFRPLLERRTTDPNKVGIDGTAMIHFAARNGTVEVLNLLLDHGADIHQTTAEGRTALVLAVRAGKNLNVSALRARGATNAGLRPVDELVGACVRADVPATKAILSAHPEVSNQIAAEDYEVLVKAAGINILDRVKLMLNCGFDPGGFAESGVTALHLAAWHGHVEMVRVLLEFHAPINVRDRTYGGSPRAWAEHGSKHCRSAEEDYAAIVAALVSAGA